MYNHCCPVLMIFVLHRHPGTGEEALYVNRQFTRRIVNLKREESGTFSARMQRIHVLNSCRGYPALALRPHRQERRPPGE